MTLMGGSGGFGWLCHVPTEPLSLQFYSYSALLLCCLACSAAFVDFYCLSGLLLPLSLCCLACSAAFVDFYCLSGHGRLCRLLLPLSTFTAFLGFYCLCRLLLHQSTVADFVDFYCLCRLLLPLSTFTAYVGFHCLCLMLLSLSTMLTLTTECRNLLIGSTILLLHT